MNFKNNHTACMNRGNAGARRCVAVSQFVVAYKSGKRKGRRIPMCRMCMEGERTANATHVQSVTAIVR